MTRGALIGLAALVVACRPEGADSGGASASSASAGTAARLAESASSVHRAPVDCAAGRLVFTSERDGRRQLYVSCPDGSNVARLVSSEYRDHAAAVARDGSLAVLGLRGEGGEPGYEEQLSLFDGTLRALAKPRARLRNPSFFPDGRRLAVEADLGKLSGVALLDRAGKLVPLTHDDAGAFEPAVSPDGQHIAFVSSQFGDAEIMTMRADGTEPVRLTYSRGDDTAPSWSPDGRQLAFLSSRGGVARLFVMNADGGKPRPLDQEDVNGETEAVWSPDGAELAYIAVRPDSASLRIVRVADGALVTEDRGAFRDETPSFSPDGQFVVFASNRGGDVELYVIPREGGEVTRVTRSPGVDFLPRWLPPDVKTRGGAPAGSPPAPGTAAK